MNYGKVFWELQSVLLKGGFLACFLLAGQTAGAQCPVTQEHRTLIAAARSQVGVTTNYTPAYSRLKYPGGDVAPEDGVCTDVIIRAYRKAFNYDLQKVVHEDMKVAFASYPKIWGLTKTDRNIDHRRVPNLQTFFTRKGSKLPVSQDSRDYCPGDMVTQMLGGTLPHIGIVSDKLTSDGKRPLIIHNIGAGAKEEDGLFNHPITGHYRLFPTHQ